MIDNVELPLLYRKMAAKEHTRLAKEVLDRVGLSSSYCGTCPAQLFRRTVPACSDSPGATVGNPEIILAADEPTGNLDSKDGCRGHGIVA